jgi:hypothetical protein
MVHWESKLPKFIAVVGLILVLIQTARAAIY